MLNHEKQLKTNDNWPANHVARLCHVPDSFCPETELFAIVCKKLVQEKIGTRLINTRVR